MQFGNDVAKALEVMRKEKEICRDLVSNDAVEAGCRLAGVAENLWDGLKGSIIELLESEIPYEYPSIAVWWYSILMGIKKDPEIFQKFFYYVKKNRKGFSLNTQYFLYYQFVSLMFQFQELNIQKIKIEMWEYRREIVEEFAKKVTVPLEMIPQEERNDDLTVVITEQFLLEQHGPTKTALDRCKVLMQKMDQQVLLINTGEVLTRVGAIPFYDNAIGSYNNSQEKEQKWKGVVVPYYQCDNNMPNIEELDHLLSKIRSMAPGHIVLIGRGGILGDLANKMVPALVVGLGPSELCDTCAEYQTLGRKMNEADIEILKAVGHTKNHVIESIFTSSLKPQTEHITKQMVEIPEDKFLIIIVGARLDVEVDDKFLRMLEEIMETNMVFGFLGSFYKYEDYISRFPRLRRQSVFFGFCKDILSWMEICDLYVNPIRSGGGTSCVEAMFKGVPVVTTGYGDVAVNAGGEFCVKDYKEMQNKILQYYNDKEYYDLMSEKAKERAELLLDTETEFVRIMREMDRRESERMQGV